MKNRVIAVGLNMEAEKNLRDMGYEIITFCKNSNVDERVAFHADLSFFAYENIFFIAHEMEYLKQDIENGGYTVYVLKEDLKSCYPQDVKLNCVVVGDYLICNVDTVAQDVLEYFCNLGKRIINVKQGYTKCSIIPVTDNAFVTDDDSIFNACSENGLDVLKVQKGSVYLKGFDYGLIGGTAGKLCDDLIVFNGDVLTHPDGEKIVAFIKKYGVKPISLTKGRLVDIGSIIGGF